MVSPPLTYTKVERNMIIRFLMYVVSSILFSKNNFLIHLHIQAFTQLKTLFKKHLIQSNSKSRL